MNEYNEGDLVEAVKGETVIRGLLVNICGLGRSLCLKLTLGIETDLIHLEANGFTITVIEKAAPVVVLPKSTVKFASGPIVMWKENLLGWVITGHDDVWGNPDLIIKTFGSDFTILEPVSETAKKEIGRAHV